MRALLACFLMLTPLAHGEQGPSDAAVSHLQKLAQDRVDLEKDIALFEGTTNEKRTIIQEHLKQMASMVAQGELRAIGERIDGDLAAALVSRIINYDPAQVQVFAIALLKRDDRWLPAPVFGSFENTGITYLPGLSDSAERLEIWMQTERNAHLIRLRESVQQDLLDDIENAGNRKKIQDGEPSELVQDFLQACRDKNLPATLAYLGGLENPLPKDWDDILAFTANSMQSGKDSAEAWRKLVSTSGARCVIKTETYDDGATVSIGEISPFESTPDQPAITVLHFPLVRSQTGLWRLRLPSWLLDGVLPDEADSTDQELLSAFPAKLLAQQPAASYSDPDAMMEAFQRALAGSRFEAILPFIGLTESSDPMEILERATRIWRDFRSRDYHAPLFLKVQQDDDKACALISLFDARNPKISANLIKRLFLAREATHWKIPSSGEIQQMDDTPELINWADETSKLSQSEWLDQLGQFAVLEALTADSAPREDQARTAARVWLDAIQAKDPRAILSSVAAFDDERGIRNLLRTIGHELQASQKSEILKIHRHGRWAAASTRSVSPVKGEEPYILLYPIVSTSSGPRVLAEATLFHAATRSREFLNASTWTRLELRLSDSAVDELKEIQKVHTRLAESP